MYDNEVKRILKMVEEGKISPEEGARLMDALGVEQEVKKKGKYVKIYIESSDGERVNIRFPLKLVKIVHKFIPRKFMKFSYGDSESLDLSELLDVIESEVGDYIDITSEDGDVVKISVE